MACNKKERNEGEKVDFFVILVTFMLCQTVPCAIYNTSYKFFCPLILASFRAALREKEHC